MDGKFLGVGLTNVVGIAVMTIIIIVISKVVFNRYEVKGVTDVVNAI